MTVGEGSVEWHRNGNFIGTGSFSARARSARPLALTPSPSSFRFFTDVTLEQRNGKGDELSRKQAFGCRAPLQGRGAVRMQAESA